MHAECRTRHVACMWGAETLKWRPSRWMGESMKASSGFLWASGRKALRAQTFIAFATFSLQRAQPHLPSNHHAALSLTTVTPVLP